MHSSTRPQRASRTTSRTGARPWCTPSARMEEPIAAPICLDQLGVEGRAPRQRRGEGRRLPGGQAGQALLVGEGGDAQPGLALEPGAARPRAATRARSAGSTGRVPKTRVRCPSPWRANSSSCAGVASSASRPAAGATTSPSSVEPRSRPSGASFSSQGHPGVQASTRSETTGSAGTSTARSVTRVTPGQRWHAASCGRVAWVASPGTARAGVGAGAGRSALDRSGEAADDPALEQREEDQRRDHRQRREGEDRRGVDGVLGGEVATPSGSVYDVSLPRMNSGSR